MTTHRSFFMFLFLTGNDYLKPIVCVNNNINISELILNQKK